MPPSEHEQEKVERLRRAMYSRSLSEKLKEKERRALRPTQPIVGDDFVRHSDPVAQTTVAPRMIGFARTFLWWLLGLALLFCLGSVGFFAYYFGFGGGSVIAAPGNVDISVTGPPRIEGGASTELQIVVANRNKVPLQLAELVITYPSGTRSPTDFSTELPSQRISLGAIEAGGQRQGTVSAVFAGKEGEHTQVKVDLEYRINGSSAIFAASTQYPLTFSSSPLTLAVEGNQETVSGQPVQLTVSVSSNTNAPIKDVLLQAQYPFGFSLTSASPEPEEAGLWELGDLAPGDTRSVVIEGTLDGAQGDDRVFRFDAGTRALASSTAITTTVARSAFTVGISKPFLGLTIRVGGEESGDVVVSPGDTVPVIIAWQNNLSTAITNAVIVARLSGIQVDGSTVHTTDGFYRSSDNVMLWDKSTTRGALADLPPGAHGTVNFSFQIPSGDALKGVTDPYLDIAINAAGRRVSETGVPQNLQSTLTKKIGIASDLSLAVQGLYYANPFGSTGPMPPRAGEETTYAVVFTVTNTTNKVTDAAVTAHLPPYVRWAGIYSPSTERVRFNQLDGTVTWDVGDIEPGAGLNGTAPRQIAIAVGLTPSTSQIGQQPPVLEDISFSGTDASTGARLTRGAKDVTTNISGDPGFSSANATVVK